MSDRDGVARAWGRAVLVVGPALLALGCSTSSSTVPMPTSSTPEPVTATTEARIEIPPDIVAVLPVQNREDPAKRQFQAKILNQTRDRFTVLGVQVVWDGFTTPVAERRVVVVGGQRVDLPVPFPGATCSGDGTLATMPEVATAVARLQLDDGSVREVPVIDQQHVMRRLYLEDCERQQIEAAVGIEWRDLHEELLDGRPVTVGRLHLTRRATADEVRITAISNTIPFTIEPIDGTAAPIVTLPAGAETAEVTIRFVEGRCDPHAIAETKQPFKFIAQVEIGDDAPRPYIVTPPDTDQDPMLARVATGCEVLGKVAFAGD